MAKKDGQLRLIFDCREANEYCRCPPVTEMCTPAALGGVDLSWPEGANAGQHDLSLSSLDLIDAFHQLGYTGLSFFLRIGCQVIAGPLDVQQVCDEVTQQYIAVASGELVFPALAILPYIAVGLFMVVVFLSFDRFGGCGCS